LKVRDGWPAVVISLARQKLASTFAQIGFAKRIPERFGGEVVDVEFWEKAERQGDWCWARAGNLPQAERRSLSP